MDPTVTAQALTDVAAPYWEAEAEITRRFFASGPSKDAHIYYLKAQLWKELNPVDGYFNGLHRELSNLVEQFPKIDQEIDRHDYLALFNQLIQEFNHYVVLADILEHLLGRPIAATDTVQLAEEKKLGAVRRGYAEQSDPVLKAAVRLTEGGGARMFREGAKVTGGKLEQMTAEAMQVIYEDERDHVEDAGADAVTVIRSATDVERMNEALRAISLQRVRMRNEMFGYPMDEAEIEAFIEGIEGAAGHETSSKGADQTRP